MGTLENVGDVFHPIYREMRERNTKNVEASGFRADGALQKYLSQGYDDRLCLAVYNIFRQKDFVATPTFTELMAELRDTFGNQVVYDFNECGGNSTGVLHHTFMQVVGFNVYNETYPGGSLPREQVEAIGHGLNSFVGCYKINFCGVIAVPTGLLLMGIPSYDINAARTRFRQWLVDDGRDLKEPYVNDICHATLLRITTDVSEEEKRKLLSIAEKYYDVDLGCIEINSFSVGPSTWLMRPGELAQHRQDTFMLTPDIRFAPITGGNLSFKEAAAIIGHRGLDHNRTEVMLESSVESFQDHLAKGYGLEFDPVLLSDGEMVAFHDNALDRMSQGASNGRKTEDCTLSELQALFKAMGGTVAKLQDLLSWIGVASSKHLRHVPSFMHLKGNRQDSRTINSLVNILKQCDESTLSSLVIFDLKPDVAKAIKAEVPSVALAASVSHPYDIHRYNECVHGTLLSMDEVISMKDIYSWAWLDEWDRVDKDGAKKALLTHENLNLLRENKIKIGLVTPELHKSSPGLLGGEAHEDASDKEKLFHRIGEVLACRPDAVCTDYPSDVTRMELRKLAECNG